MVTCFECDNDRSKIDDRSLNSPINRFRFGSRFSALVNIIALAYNICSKYKHEAISASFLQISIQYTNLSSYLDCNDKIQTEDEKGSLLVIIVRLQ